MGFVVEAKIQTVEDIYRLVQKAVSSRQPISAIYETRPRLLCPHRLGRNKAGEARVLCYQYGGESSSKLEPSGSPANWRCMMLEKFSRVELVEGIWWTAPNHSRPQTCITDVDADAEDYRECTPQSGQRERSPAS